MSEEGPTIEVLCDPAKCTHMPCMDERRDALIKHNILGFGTYYLSNKCCQVFWKSLSSRDALEKTVFTTPTGQQKALLFILTSS